MREEQKLLGVRPRFPHLYFYITLGRIPLKKLLSTANPIFPVAVLVLMYLVNRKHCELGCPAGNPAVIPLDISRFEPHRGFHFGLGMVDDRTTPLPTARYMLLQSLH